MAPIPARSARSSRQVKIAIPNVIDRGAPIVCATAITADPAPAWSGRVRRIASEYTAAWCSPKPAPARPTRTAIPGSDTSASSPAIHNSPTAVTAAPAAVTTRSPIRSASHPPMIEPAVDAPATTASIAPMARAPRPSTSVTKNGNRNQVRKLATNTSTLDTPPAAKPGADHSPRGSTGHRARR